MVAICSQTVLSPETCPCEAPQFHYETHVPLPTTSKSVPMRKVGIECPTNQKTFAAQPDNEINAQVSAIADSSMDCSEWKMISGL